MEGLGLGSGLLLNTAAAPVKVISLSKGELDELKSHIDERVELTEEELKNELLRVIDTLLSNRLPNTNNASVITDLKRYKEFLERGLDTVEHIRSALLGNFFGLMAAAQAGGGRRRRRRSRKTKRCRSRKNRHVSKKERRSFF